MFLIVARKQFYFPKGFIVYSEAIISEPLSWTPTAVVGGEMYAKRIKDKLILRKNIV